MTLQSGSVRRSWARAHRGEHTRTPNQLMPSRPTGGRTVNICVVGLGKIGLPLAVQCASKGHVVIGADIDMSVVEHINAAREPFVGEAQLAEKLNETVNAGLLQAT